MMSKSCLVLSFGRHTKVKQPFRADMTTTIEEDPIPQQVLDHLSTLKPHHPITTVTTAQLEALLRELPVPKSILEENPTCRQHFTAHSIKTGALNVLFQAAAEGRLDPRLIAMLGKHKNRLTEEVPQTTIRYNRAPAALSRALGSHLATSLL